MIDCSSRFDELLGHSSWSKILDRQIRASKSRRVIECLILGDEFGCELRDLLCTLRVRKRLCCSVERSTHLVQMHNIEDLGLDLLSTMELHKLIKVLPPPF